VALLEAEGVSSGYDQMEILHGVTLEVGEAEIVTLIGPNGAGKSTLLKTVFGLLRPTHGRIRFRGEDIGGLPPNAIVRRGVSYVPQTENVFPSLTVEENLELGAVTRTDDVRPRMKEIMTLFPVLAERRAQRAGTLSGGERQMLAMGRALMLDPALLLLDEPSSGLAPLLVEAVFSRIVEINRTGVAILLVEQNAREALEFSSRAYVLAGGQRRLHGPASQLLHDDEVARLYLGG
jgi:ABC-type branched-subunit amino acid transport system ATPase component